MRWPAEFLDDLRYALRTLRRSRTFAIAAVLTLGLGIGVNTAVFSVVNALLFRPLPVRDGERLVVLATQVPGTATLGPMSAPDLRDFRGAAGGVLEDVAGYTVGFIGLAPEGGRPARVLVTWVTGNYFELLGIEPALGRLIQSPEGSPGRIDPVVVLGHRAWLQRFDADPSIVGKTTRVNGRTCTIIGVVPPTFHGTFAFSDPEIYLPVTWAPGFPHDDRALRTLHTLARLREGTAMGRAQAVADVIAARLAHEHPVTNAGVEVSVLPERAARPEENNARSNQFAAAVLLGLVTLVLLAAMVNVTNLFLARSAGRRRELAVRAALGASRGRLVRHLLAETALLCCLGGVAGLALGAAAARALAFVRLPGDLPVRFEFHFDQRVMVYTLALVLATALVVVMASAWRVSGAGVDESLRDGGPGATAGRRTHRVRKMLVVAQVAAAFVLTVQGVLFARSLANAAVADLGFIPDGVLNVQMDVAQVGYPESRGRAFFEEVERRVRSLPGVERVAYAFTVPLGYVNVSSRLQTLDTVAARTDQTHAGKNIVGPEYFSTLSIRLESGRGFSERDALDAPPVAVVNRRLADLLWPGRNPIGERFREADGPWTTVVGVTATGKYRLLFEDPRPHFYVPSAQQYTALRVLHLRTGQAPEALAPVVERLIHDLEPDLPLYDVQAMSTALDGARGRFLVRAAALCAGVLATLALLLTATGLYGVVSHLTSERTREIGVRIALGASAAGVVRLVLSEAAGLTLRGIVLGLLVAYAQSSLLQRVLFGDVPAFPSFVAATVCLFAVTGAAAWLPARRAARVGAVRALRE